MDGDVIGVKVRAMHKLAAACCSKGRKLENQKGKNDFQISCFLIFIFNYRPFTDQKFGR